jgi:hypothetical protein
MINMPLKWHHIGICSNNCGKVNMLTMILANLHPLGIIVGFKNKSNKSKK